MKNGVIVDSKSKVTKVGDALSKILKPVISFGRSRDRKSEKVTKRKKIVSCSIEGIESHCEKLKDYLGEVTYTVVKAGPNTTTSRFYFVVVTGPKEKVKVFLKNTTNYC